jgi:hypothetical protein
MPDSDLLFPLLLGIALIIGNLSYFWRHRQKTVGAVVTYLIFFTAIYLFQPIMNVLPWYQPLYDTRIIYAGLVQVTVALVSLTFGIHIVAPILRTFHRGGRKTVVTTQDASRHPAQNQNLMFLYIGISLISYFVLTPILGNISTVQTLLTGTSKLLHIGLILGFWFYIQHIRSRATFLLCTFLTLIWPLITVTTTGFLGTGIAPTIFVLIFVLMRHKAGKRLLLLSPLIGFILLSFISTYFNNRTNLRNLVWGGAATGEVLDYTFRTYSENFTWINLYEPKNLIWIDYRLNLPYFTGLAVSNLENGTTTYAGGETINNALLILVPRILWPDKPIQVGGSDLIARYTNLYFSLGSTFSMGQVMELYVNYGSIGVIVGFILLGIVIVTIDRRAAAALAHDDSYRFALWVMPFFGFLLIEDNFNNMFPTALSGVLAIYGVNLLLKSLVVIRHRRVQMHTPRRVQSAVTMLPEKPHT